MLIYSSFVHKFRLREKPTEESSSADGRAYECLCIASQNLGTVRRAGRRRRRANRRRWFSPLAKIDQ